LEASLSRVIASLFGHSHSAISNALRAYDRLVLKESRNIHANLEKNEEAQCQIKKSQLNIERVQKSLVDDIRAVVKSTDEVRAGTSPGDIRALKRRAEVSPAIFYFSHSTIPAFVCQPFFLCQSLFCVSHFIAWV
jgi:hypothetical protein